MSIKARHLRPDTAALWSGLSRWLIVLGLIASIAPAIAEEGQSVLIPHARQYDFVSKINGQRYRLFIRVPTEAAPDHGYPVFYVLDANYYFGTVSDEAQRLIHQKLVVPFIVVGIGYPTDDMDEVGTRRDFDLSLPLRGKKTARYGGAEAFSRVLNEEIKPFVATHFNVAAADQTLFGHSFGGLFVLHELFLHPDALSAYAASSPSIFWSDKAVLQYEGPFAERVKQGAVRAKVLIMSGGKEQDTKTAPQTLMIDNASHLADRLASLNPQQMPVSRVIFPGEIHATVPQPATSRAIIFAIPSARGPAQGRP